MIARQFPAFILPDDSPLPDTDKHVMGFIHFARREIAVIGRNQRHVMIIRQLNQARFDLLFKRLAVSLQLDIEAVAKDAL